MNSAISLAATICLLLIISASACENSSHHHHHHHHHHNHHNHHHHRHSSHSSAPAPETGGGGGGSNCTAAVMSNMITCMDYVLEGQSEKKPDEACCEGTKEVIKEEGAKCLCEAFAAAPQYGLIIDGGKAAQLPSLCQITGHHYLSICLGSAEVPVPAPAKAAMAPSPKPEPHHKLHTTTSAPAPSPEEGSSSLASVSYGLMAIVALLPLAFSV